MKQTIWNINEILAIGENVIYECVLEDENNDKVINVYLTNHRIIWINDNFVDSHFLNSICKCGVFFGYEEYGETSDYGTGEYGVYFGDMSHYDTFWFYDVEVAKTFYLETTRVIIDIL